MPRLEKPTTPEELGVRLNTNMWIGDGWFHCLGCNRDTPHRPYSHTGQADCYLLCTVCKKIYQTG